MMFWEWVRFIAAAMFILGGIAIAVIATFGLFRFRFVLNRMHAAALCDTLALAAVIVGLIIINGFSLFSLKLFLVILFLWLASPISSHLIARLEVTTNEELTEHLDVETKED